MMNPTTLQKPVATIKNILLIRFASQHFKSSPHLRNIRAPMELAYSMANLEKEGFQTSIIDGWIENLSLEQLLDRVSRTNPDLIVASCTTDASDRLLKFARMLKNSLSPMMAVVGQHVSAEPDGIIFQDSPIDFCVIGEPELMLTEAIKNINQDKPIETLKGVYTVNGGNKEANMVKDLDSLPFINHQIFNEDQGYTSFYPMRMSKRLKWGYLMTSRGCPYDCTFCSQTMRDSYGKKPRLRSPENTVAEIKLLMKQGVNIITFCDDNFTTLASHITGVCQEILKHNIDVKWVIHARVDNLNAELMTLMKKAGCVLLRMGVESASERIVKVLKKTSHPGQWHENVVNIFHQAAAIGLPTSALFIIGSPTETRQDILETIKFSCTLKTDMIQVNYFTPYPGSSYYRENQEEIRREKGTNYYHYQIDQKNDSRVSSSELKNLHWKFYRDFYFRPSFILHHLRHYSGFYFHNATIFKQLFMMFFKIGRNQNS